MRLLTVLKYEPLGRRRKKRKAEGMCFPGNGALDLVVSQHTLLHLKAFNNRQVVFETETEDLLYLA